MTVGVIEFVVIPGFLLNQAIKSSVVVGGAKNTSIPLPVISGSVTKGFTFFGLLVKTLLCTIVDRSCNVFCLVSFKLVTRFIRVGVFGLRNGALRHINRGMRAGRF